MPVKATTPIFAATLFAAMLWMTGSVVAQDNFFDPTKMAPPADANKSFSFGEDKSNSLFGASNTSFNKSFTTKGADGLFGRTANVGGKDFIPPSVTMDKTYVARSYTLPGNFTGYDENTPNIPMKASLYSSQSAAGFNRTIDMPTYTGPEAQKIKRDMEEINKTLGNTKDLPNRSLTVQEVRDLLNHNKKPDQDPTTPSDPKK